MSNGALRSGADDARRRIADLPIWPSPPSIEPCPGGRSNENFRVRCGDRVYFARVGEDVPHHGITRRNEARCCELAAAAGVGPAVVYAADGILVTEFVPGRTLLEGEPIDDDTVRQLATALVRLHRAPVPRDLTPFDPEVICRRYLALLPGDRLAAARRRRAEAILAAAPPLRACSLVHGDVLPGNVIVDAGRLVLVDWEYGGYGDPAVDTALVVTHFGLDARQTALLIGSHGGADAAIVKALAPALALREALWCEVQIDAEGVRGDIESYAATCWRRLEHRP